ncbi:MAG TPA: class I SAM-dependent methyltransferase [Chloroflexia bacterium]|nr:class I SAM-dependent methyltransferase [Chloroflexia bacterium]
MMRHDLYEDLYSKEQDYWWHVGKRAIVYSLLEKYLPPGDKRTRRAMDLGCGTGHNLESLSRYGEPVGLDSSGEALEFCRRRGHRHLVQAASLPFADASFDIVTALDVIEHLDDDLATLRELYRVMRPGGILIISVPAYRILWSYWDQILGHRRRYTTVNMRRVVRRAGWRVRKVSYSNMAILVPGAALRLVKGLTHRTSRVPMPASDREEHMTAEGPASDFMNIPGWLNTVMIGYYRGESRVLRDVNLPFGLSVVCVAQKPRQ